MTPMLRISALAFTLAAFPAAAQSPTPTVDREAQAEAEESAEDAERAPQAEEAAAEETEEVDPDNMAANLNAAQQLQQSVTFTRTINGEVVETTTKTVTLPRGTPYRQTEAGKSIVEELSEEFDSEVLTRTEAFEEAKLDFTLADADRDGSMTADEFSALVVTWRDTGRTAASPDLEEAARRKFGFMAGMQSAITRKEYLQEVMTDFDAMDENKDGFLQSAELGMFRALNRGATLDQ